MTSPRVFVDEDPAGPRVIAGSPTSIAAFVGRAARGVTETPVTVTNVVDLERVFGGLWDGSTLGFSVRDFFANGGTTALVVRLYRPETGRRAKPARAALAVGTLDLVAADEGAWGNALRARVEVDTRTPDGALGETSTSLFDLFVRDGTTGAIEEHRDLVVAPPEHPRQVSTVLERESRLVRVRAVGRKRPKASRTVVDAGKTVWDDNTVPTNAAVTEPASDGRRLTAASFIAPDRLAKSRGLHALDHADRFNLLVIPPYKKDASVDTAVVAGAARYCEQRRAMLIVDGPPAWTTAAEVTGAVAAGFEQLVGTTSANAAVYVPRLRQPNSLHGDRLEGFAAAGAVAGVIARTDAHRGVWKAPAGVAATVTGVTELAVALTDPDVERLASIGVNCLRQVHGAGVVVWGARTLAGADAAASEWKYLPVRRLALFLEDSLMRGTQWVVFEPNGEALWARLRLQVESFLHGLFRQGAFAGATPRDAYYVRCDRTTMSQADIDVGVVSISVGFAPLKPAEFVVITIRQIADRTGTIEPRATWSDLSLAAAQEQTLRDVCRDARAESGMAVLFVGGDTVARRVTAEVVAGELDRDLSRVDLAGVVSKYIGETEKNLRRLFDVAERGGGILFFDEADALFGKRTDVQDSHDRYANLDVAFLLARIEASTGIVILATNDRATVDDAVGRRTRYVIDLGSPVRPPREGGPR